MKQYNEQVRDDESRKFYASSAWRKMRDAYISEHPLCEECERQGRVTVGRVVDHVRPIKQGGAKLSASNLQTLCQSCHEAKSNREGSRGGY